MSGGENGAPPLRNNENDSALQAKGGEWRVTRHKNNGSVGKLPKDYGEIQRQGIYI